MPANKKILVVSFQSLTANSGGGMARLGYYLSEILDKKDILQDFIVFSKGKYTTSFKSSPVSYWSRHILFVLNKLDKIFKFPPHKFRLAQEIIYDWFCVNKITSNTGLLFVTQPYLPRTFKKAKKLGIDIIFIPANPEENSIRKLILEEQKILNIVSVDAYTYGRRIDLFNKSIKYVDRVIGTYPTVYDTYKSSSFKGEVVKMIGHLKPDFKPVNLKAKEPSTNTFKVGYLAHTVVLKGLQYLLQAWDILNKEYPDLDIELLVAGNIDDSMREYITTRHQSSIKVKFLGKIPDVPAFLQTLDLFVVPSLMDGGPYTALEAAHYGIPVLISENCGSAELLSRNENGCMIVPIKNALSITEKIVWAYKNRPDAIKMGMNAKHNLDTYRMDELVADIANYLEKSINTINSNN